LLLPQHRIGRQCKSLASLTYTVAPLVLPLVALVAILLTHYAVFNVEQCDGLKLPEMLPTTEPNDIEIDETSEAIVQGWQARPELQLTSASEGRAYYRPITDSVHMPARFRYRQNTLRRALQPRGSDCSARSLDKRSNR
jgi:hypothetical protein